jgi:hypothetical protein
MNSFSAKTALLAILFGPTLMRADVVFSNVTGLGAPINSHVVCGSASCNNTVAQEFTPSANFSMTDALVDVARVSDFSTFDVFLDANSGGAPGATIEQIGFALSATASFPGSLITANTISTQITLTSGTPYWLVVSPHQANSEVSWAGGGSSATPQAVSLDGGNTWPFVNTGGLGTC